MNAEIKPLLTARERLEAALKHDAQDLPRSAYTTVRVGDVREILKKSDTWKDRALVAGYNEPPEGFYAQVTLVREGKPPLRLTARYAPLGYDDRRPYKVLLSDNLHQPIGGYPTEREAFECLLAMAIGADREKNQGDRP